MEPPKISSEMEFSLATPPARFRKLFLASYSVSWQLGLVFSDEAPSLYICTHTKDERTRNENPMICIHSANCIEKTTSAPYFSFGVMFLYQSTLIYYFRTVQVKFNSSSSMMIFLMRALNFILYSFFLLVLVHFDLYQTLLSGAYQNH